MRTLVIYAHPYEQSFNYHILESLIKKDEKIDVIDLYSEKFNQIYTSEELSLFKNGKTTISVIETYQEKIKNASNIIFIFPIWWNDVPGIVKNFIDLVMKKNFAYHDTERGVKGDLTHIKSVKVITTSNSPTWYIKYFGGNAINKVFLGATFKQLGVKNRVWLNLGEIKKASDKKKKGFLEKIY